ncbi:MAG: M23 family metallopeptidase [Leptospiraceae bacterium]|nr:M23 family metallopeptidase [Leptospiraceae bacterium]MCP5495855.1 M23 family metallopeptidase [Leptospiraceae bacterium]
MIFRLLVIFAILYSFSTIEAKVVVLESLDYSNPYLMKLRQEIKHNLQTVKSRNGHGKMIPLKFYQYKIQKDDTFFKIMAKTGMNIDTLSSVNSLSSQHDIYEGMILLIPNMRGTYENQSLEPSKKNKKKLAKKYNILSRNVIYDSNKKEWFIAGKNLDKIESDFFYGRAFSMPINKGEIEVPITEKKDQKNGFSKPVSGYVSSKYGLRLDPFTKKKTFHGGIDIAAPKGTYVYASAKGKVIMAENHAGYGNLIVVRHKKGYETRYGHLDIISVKKGQSVERGEKIGEVGNTGRATGNHLHFEVRRFKKKEKPTFFPHE